MGENDEDTSNSRQPFSIAEIVAELIYANKTIDDIANYDDVQMRWIVFRKRDKYGGLVRSSSELPDWVEVDDQGMRIVSKEVSYQAMFRQVKKKQGLTGDKVEESWKYFLSTNPEFGKHRHGR